MDACLEERKFEQEEGYKDKSDGRRVASSCSVVQES